MYIRTGTSACKKSAAVSNERNVVYVIHTKASITSNTYEHGRKKTIIAM